MTHTSEVTYDVAVLGGGPAGYVAAIRASQMGARVVLIEKLALGGVCMNVGCLPRMALLKTSELIFSVKGAKEFGLESRVENIRWDMAGLRKDRVVKNLRIGIEQLMKGNRIDVIYGRGSVRSAHKLEDETTDGRRIVSCRKLILATGSKPLIPSFIKGAAPDGVLTSTDMLEITKVPETLAVIGGGVIGVEFAAMFAAAGTKVTVLELKDRIVSTEDYEVAAELAKILKRQGIVIKTSVKVKEVKEEPDGLTVTYEEKGKNQKLVCENVLLSIGRELETEAVGALGLEMAEGGRIVVDEYMQTSVQDVYAAGDVTGGKLLAHLAFMEGRIAAENAMGMKNTLNYRAVPACIYTSPESASVGMTEEEAERKGIHPQVGKFYMRHNGRALTLGEREGFVKVVADEKGVILGGQILGANASEMISELTLAVMVGATAEILADMIHPHPSVSEAVWEACGEIAGKAIHKI